MSVANLIAGEFGSANFCDATSASSSRTETSMPSSAAGTKPKALSALNLPPTLGSALITRNLDALADISRGESGSVTITK